ncbi:MAG TPA: hypothetical protein VNI61_04795 [Gemmatimonadales bacterium]|nr:hypothetical protein [Gemmatimonadales bacterium]
MRVAVLVAVLGVLATVPAAAQTPAYDRSLRSFTAPDLPARTPALSAAPAGSDLLLQRRRGRRSAGTVFLIVGGAVAVAGIIADEGLLVVGGVVVAGYGLYLNLR